jgi:hypothetical protein
MTTPLDLYVTADPTGKRGVQIVSTMHALRRDARGATFRCPDTGHPLPEGPSPSWLGTIGYLVLAEQIGTAVYDTTKGKQSPGLKRAIDHFGPKALPAIEQEALRSLRNAYAHDFGLVSQGRRNTKTGLWEGRYAFQLLGRAPKLVDVGPSIQVWTAGAPATHATVAVIDLADYVEALVERVIEAHTRSEVGTDLPGGGEELRARLLFTASL